MGEFWVGQSDQHSVKLAASAGHLNGRPIIGAESFTSQSRWTECPYSLKQLGDFMYSQGLNRFIFHRYTHQPHPDVTPGMTMGPWGSYFERTNTWFEPGKAWFDYLARCQFMLQQGKFVGDLLYFTGENSPVVAPPRSKLRPAPPRSSDFDTIDANTILTRLKIHDGRIVLPDGLTYRLLVLSSDKAFSLDLLRKIRDLVDQGMCLVVNGPKPEQIPGLSGYPASDAELAKVAGELWADLNGEDRVERACGNGRVFWGMPIADVLEKLDVKPDCDFAAASPKAVVHYTHRRTADADIYFVANRGQQSEEVICTFNVDGKCPELWDPATGQAATVAIYDTADGRTRLPLRLDPSGSVFVVFRRPNGAKHLQSVTKGDAVVVSTETFTDEARQRAAQLTAHAPKRPPDGMKGEATPIPGSEEPLAVEWSGDAKGGLLVWQNGVYTLRDKQGQTKRVEVSNVEASQPLVDQWQVKFPPKLGAPPEIKLDELISWTEHSDAGVKYFSGTATYIRQFSVDARQLSGDKRLYLDLGRIEVLGKVLVNGKDLGTLWKPPFRVDITEAVHPARTLWKCG